MTPVLCTNFNYIAKVAEKLTQVPNIAGFILCYNNIRKDVLNNTSISIILQRDHKFNLSQERKAARVEQKQKHKHN